MKKLEPYENQMMYLVGGSRLHQLLVSESWSTNVIRTLTTG